jgi:hypothetical protein
VAEVPIENWVKLKPGVPKTMHWPDHRIVDREITDPVTKRRKTVQSLTFDVDEEDGRECTKSFSVVSEKLAGDLAGYLEGKRYRGYDFTIIKDRAGFVAPRIVEVRPR